jgi:hypothetical protein
MIKRPPKPPSISTSPRYKHKRQVVRYKMELKAIQEALSALRSGELLSEHFEDFQQQANAEKNDRGAAILIATNLENALQHAIEVKLKIETKRRKELFRYDSPAGTFASKIIIAHAVHIFGPETRKNLDIVRLIRNAFAHAKIPIHFETEAVATACAKLKMPAPLQPLAVRLPLETSGDVNNRKKFQTLCERTANNLFVVSMPSIKGTFDLSDPLHSNALTQMTPESLP